MNLTIPGVGSEAGPDYAIEINNNFNTLDTHDHTVGKGVLIPVAGLNINATLPFNSNSASNMLSLGLINNTNTLSGAYTNYVYANNKELYFNDGNGVPVQITNSGAVNVTSSGISNGTANASLIGGALVVTSSPTVAGNIDGASLILRNNTPSSYGITLSAPAALSNDYNVVLPALPGSGTNVMTLNSSGNMASITYDAVGVNMTSVGSQAIATSMGTVGANTIAGAMNSTGTSSIASVMQANSQWVLPPGMIAPYAGAAAPTGWLLCDGSAVSRSTYAALFAVVGTTYGYGDGSTTFNVPNTAGTFIRGSGSTTRYTFTISSATVSQGAIYSNNSQTFRVIAAVTSSTSIIMAGSGAPLATGTLTKVAGAVGDPASITFSGNTSITYSGTLGAGQNDQAQGHRHGVAMKANNSSVPSNLQLATTGNTYVFASDGTLGNNAGGTNSGDGNSKDPVSDGTNGTPRTGTQTHPANVTMNYIIKT